MSIPTLSDHIADSAVCNVLNVIQGQLEERMLRAVKANPTIPAPDYLQKPFASEHGWIMAGPYSDMRFKFNYSHLTFLQLCNAIEVFHGITIEHLFMDELTKRVKQTVRKVLEQHNLSLEAVECEKSARSCGTVN